MEKIQGESIVRQSSVELKENERIDDLQRNGYKIIQNRDKFCFGMDAVLLSGFAQVRPGERVIDLGTGTGSYRSCWKPGMRGRAIQGWRFRKRWQRWRPEA